MNKNIIMKISMFTICSFLVSVLVWLPTLLTILTILAYIGMLLNYIGIINKDILVIYLPTIGTVLSSIISIYIGVSLSKSILKDE